MSNCEFQDDNSFINDDDLTSNRCFFTARVDSLDNGSLSEPLLDLVEIEFNSDLNLDADDFKEITKIVNDAVALADSYIDELTGQPDFEQQLNFVFGDDFTIDALEKAWEDLSEKKIAIEVVSDDDLDGLGTFGNSTIFLAEDSIAENIDRPEVVARVFLEEFAHYLDDLANLTIDNTIAEVTVTDDLRLTGSLEDTGSGISNLNYSFNNGEAIPVEINENGEFNVELNTDGLENSFPTLTVTTTDIAGNTTSKDITVAVPITTESGLQYIDLQEGNDVMPNTGQQVTVHYTGTLEDGTKFDSSRARDTPFSF